MGKKKSDKKGKGKEKTALKTEKKAEKKAKKELAKKGEVNHSDAYIMWKLIFYNLPAPSFNFPQKIYAVKRL